MEEAVGCEVMMPLRLAFSLGRGGAPPFLIPIPYQG